MRRVCLSLPTHRPCSDTLRAVAAEAAHGGAREFGAEVHLLVLDSADPPARETHRETLAALPESPGVVIHHLDEAAQHRFLAKTVAHSGAADPDRLVSLLLPEGISYGACTNRAFLIAESLGCASVHRRDSDSGYQQHDGAPVHPLAQELAHLGERAGVVRNRVSTSRLDPAQADRPVAWWADPSSDRCRWTSMRYGLSTPPCTRRSSRCPYRTTHPRCGDRSWWRTRSAAGGEHTLRRRPHDPHPRLSRARRHVQRRPHPRGLRAAAASARP